MTEKTLGILVKHFCLDSVDSNDKMIQFPPQSLKSVVIMDIFGKFIVYSLEDIFEEIRQLNTLEEIKEKLSSKAKEMIVKRYYFIDNKTKLKKKSKKDTTIKTLKCQSDLTDLEQTCTYDELEDAYVSLNDICPTGIYKDGVLYSECSLLKLDDVYDLGVISRKDVRGKGYGKKLIYEFLKKEAKDKLIRMIVPENNIPMISLCDSLGLTSEIRFLEIKLK